MYITEKAIKETVDSLYTLFVTKEDLVKEIKNSLKEHKQYSAEYYFFKRMLEHL